MHVSPGQMRSVVTEVHSSNAFSRHAPNCWEARGACHSGALSSTYVVT